MFRPNITGRHIHIHHTGDAGLVSLLQPFARANKTQFFLIGQNHDNAIPQLFHLRLEGTRSLDHRQRSTRIIDHTVREGPVAQHYSIIVGGHDNIALAFTQGDDHIGARHRSGLTVTAFEGVQIIGQIQRSQMGFQHLQTGGIALLNQLSGHVLDTAGDRPANRTGRILSQHRL